MITRDQAERIADEILRDQPKDVEMGWTLEEFSAGWLVRRNAVRDSRGAASIVVEKATGRVMNFPSYVPPIRILEEYDQVVEDGYPDA